uniref:Uncharacterized protein n=1 Tax=Salmonella phage vB_SEnST11_KE22 TaxID=3161173 RepID=A0AAU8GHZ6_9CAUD
MAKLGKRKYPALYNKNTGLWYTGYAHDWKMEEKVDKSDKHEIRHLEIQYSEFSRGMSAANIIMKDENGYPYLMSLSGFDLLMKLVDAPADLLRKENLTKYDILRKTSLSGNGVWYVGSFCQTKQGQNYFIEPVEVSR